MGTTVDESEFVDAVLDRNKCNVLLFYGVGARAKVVNT